MIQPAPPPNFLESLMPVWDVDPRIVSALQIYGVFGSLGFLSWLFVVIAEEFEPDYFFKTRQRGIDKQ